MQDYQDGQILPGPNGPMRRELGQWVLTSTAPMTSHPPGFTGPQAVARNAAETRSAVANAAAAEANARTAQFRAEEAQRRHDAENVTAPGNTSLTGEAYLATLPPADANMVRAMHDGRVRLPTSGRAATDPTWQRQLAAAQHAYPDLNENTIRQLAQSRQAFLIGPQGRNALSLGTSLEHVGALRQSIANLNNFNNLPFSLNNTANAYENYMYGGGSRAAALNDFMTRRHVVASEVATAIKGGHATIPDIEGIEAQLSPNMSPDALNSTVNSLIDQVAARGREWQNSYQQAMGRPDAYHSLFSPTTQQVLHEAGHDDLLPPGFAGGGPAAPPPYPGSPPPPPPGQGGERMDATNLTAGPSAGPSVTLSPNSAADPGRAAYNLQVNRDISGMLRHGGPDGSDAAISAYARAHDLNPAYTQSILAWRRGAHPAGTQGTFQQWSQQGGLLPFEDPNPNVPLSGAAHLAADFSASPVGTAVSHAFNGVVPLATDASILGGNPDQVNTALEAQSRANPGSAVLGQLAGTAAAYTAGGRVAGMAGRALLRPGQLAAEAAVASGAEAPGATFAGRVGNFLAGGSGAAPLSTPANAVRSAVGDAAYGGVQGTGDGDPLGGAAASVAGGMFGRGAGRTLGVVARGVTDPAVQYLTQRGVPLTVGQILGQTGRFGQAIRSTEGAFSGVNPLIEGQYRQGLRGFNQAGFDEATNIVNGPSTGAIGERGLANLRGQRSTAYNNALGGQNFTEDPQFTADIGAARAKGGAITRLGPEFENNLDETVLPYVENGNLTGDNFQGAIRSIRKSRNAYADDPMGFRYGGAMNDVEGAFEGLVNRQAPGVVPDYQRANLLNRHLSILNNAVKRGQATVESGDPMFTPNQLNTASIGNTAKYLGDDAAMSTGRPFFDLTRAGQQVLPNTVPNNGARSLYGMGALSLFGAGAGAGADASGVTDHHEGTSTALTLGALATLPYTRAGRSALQAILVKRPDLMRQFGENVLSQQLPMPNVGPQLTVPQAWGMFGAGAAPYGTAKQGGLGY